MRDPTFFLHKFDTKYYALPHSLELLQIVGFLDAPAILGEHEESNIAHRSEPYRAKSRRTDFG